MRERKKILCVNTSLNMRTLCCTLIKIGLECDILWQRNIRTSFFFFFYSQSYCSGGMVMMVVVMVELDACRGLLLIKEI